jgi:hypothetical protein
MTWRAAKREAVRLSAWAARFSMEEAMVDFLIGEQRRKDRVSYWRGLLEAAAFRSEKRAEWWRLMSNG